MPISPSPVTQVARRLGPGAMVATAYCWKCVPSAKQKAATVARIIAVMIMVCTLRTWSSRGASYEGVIVPTNECYLRMKSVLVGLRFPP